jgi:hypothetical protein
VLGFASCGLAAASPALDAAVNKYYAGHTDKAIAMIRPLAVAGDVDAQYLLGNILYTLSNAGKLETMEDPAGWYRLAADQGSAPANYALGVLHNNRWLQYHREQDLRLAESYLRQALDLGDSNARVALDNLEEYSKDQRATASLTYSNESFSSKREPPPQPQPASVTKPKPRKTTLTDTLSEFESSGDPVADAQKLKQMLGQLEETELLAGSSDEDAGTLTQLLGGIESAKRLLPDLLKLFDHLEAASEIGTDPGSN